MINPNNITKYNRSESELQEFWLFCILVAGKNSQTTTKLLARLLRNIKEPFKYLSGLTKKERLSLLKFHRVGQYTRINNAITDSLNVDLKNAHFSELLQIKGVGPKTCSFFLLHSRGEELPVLDVHILKYMRSRGHNTPKQTPQNLSTYNKICSQFKKEVAIDPKYSKLSMADADLLIWKQYSNK